MVSDSRIPLEVGIWEQPPSPPGLPGAPFGRCAYLENFALPTHEGQVCRGDQGPPHRQGAGVAPDRYREECPLCKRGDPLGREDPREHQVRPAQDVLADRVVLEVQGWKQGRDGPKGVNRGGQVALACKRQPVAAAISTHGLWRCPFLTARLSPVISKNMGTPSMDRMWILLGAAHLV